ncbi:VOC family protein [Egbenema bharatensis]|uniref:VOC family protein n=1 Tax=Egbenema bharatensis TaxID=3463334 RepID=UPI003A83CE28
MISGIFENCVGSQQEQFTLRYWAELGYRELKRGKLSAAAAHALYGHASNLTSIRLQNGNSSDHGLVRIMVWQQPRNPGLQKSHPFVIGSRWFASLVQDIYAVADAFNDDNANDGDWIVTEPIRGIEFIGQPGTNFYQRFTGVREFFVIGSETRQAFFQRYNYTRPGYGVIDPASPLGVSEGTHSSIVTADHDTAAFYTDVFGLVPANNTRKRSGYQNPATRQILMLEDGNEFLLSSFSSPKTDVGVLQVYTPLYPTPNKLEFAQPGVLGISLFTYQVENIHEFHDRVRRSNARSVTPMLSNEFNEPSFGLVAPDDITWVIIG